MSQHKYNFWVMHKGVTCNSWLLVQLITRTCTHAHPPTHTHSPNLLLNHSDFGRLSGESEIYGAINRARRGRAAVRGTGQRKERPTRELIDWGGGSVTMMIPTVVKNQVILTPPRTPHSPLAVFEELDHQRMHRKHRRKETLASYSISSLFFFLSLST